MSSTEILLIINSILLGLISLLFFIVGYFLRDLHKDFKRLLDRVNRMNNEFELHIRLFENLNKVFQKQIDGLKERVKKLEEAVKLKK
jgi:hypothetical protein